MNRFINNFDKPQILPTSFYQRTDTLELAKELLGKKLCSLSSEGLLTTGLIIETEAYYGAEDKACHAHANKKTKRNAPMFAAGGIAYVYLCYGLHCLLNVVTHSEGEPHAVLIRAIEPVAGIEEMLARRSKSKLDKTLSAGPGTLTRSLGVNLADSGCDLTSGARLWIEDAPVIPAERIWAGPRIGIANYAQEDTDKPWRFRVL